MGLYNLTLPARWCQRVGWVERFRETHHLRKGQSMGIASGLAQILARPLTLHLSCGL